MNLKKLSFFLVTHLYATGPVPILEDYLKDKVESLIYISHPFPYVSDNRSSLRIYKGGKLTKEQKFIQWKGPEVLFYIKDVFLTVWWGLLYAKKSDYLIAADNLNAFSGLILRFCGKVKYVVFYTIDYIPNRFKNRLLNHIYHFLDRFAVEHCQKVWNLSPVMVEEREKRGIGKKFRSKQITVPIGTNIPKYQVSFDKINKNKIVFMGHLRQGQGVEMLIAAIKDVKEKLPKIKLLIVGGGPLEQKLREKVRKEGLQKEILFSGFIKNFLDVNKLMTDAAIAVAPYVDDDKNFTRYTDPGKVKDYLALGIPVVITKVPMMAVEIDKTKSGIAIEYDKEQLVKAILELLTNREKLKKYRQNALRVAKEYSWDKVFNKALLNTEFV